MPTLVRQLTAEEAQSLMGQTYDGGMYYNPILDADDNWIISEEEVQQTTNPVFMWVYDLPQIPYNPKPIEM